jgi:hypothetical protein
MGADGRIVALAQPGVQLLRLNYALRRRVTPLNGDKHIPSCLGVLAPVNLTRQQREPVLMRLAAVMGGWSDDQGSVQV